MEMRHRRILIDNIGRISSAINVHEIMPKLVHCNVFLPEMAQKYIPPFGYQSIKLMIVEPTTRGSTAFKNFLICLRECNLHTLATRLEYSDQDPGINNENSSHIMLTS